MESVKLLEEQVEALEAQKKQAETLFVKCDGAIESLKMAIVNLSKKKEEKEEKDSTKKAK
jgi:hypothetical protein